MTTSIITYLPRWHPRGVPPNLYLRIGPDNLSPWPKFTQHASRTYIIVYIYMCVYVCLCINMYIYVHEIHVISL